MTTHEQIKSQLAQIEQRENAATEGPWIDSTYTAFPDVFCGLVEQDKAIAVVPVIAHTVSENDKLFISHSRTDVPHLRKSLILSLECMKAVTMAIQTGHVHEVPGIIESFQQAIEEELKS